MTKILETESQKSGNVSTRMFNRLSTHAEMLCMTNLWGQRWAEPGAGAPSQLCIFCQPAQPCLWLGQAYASQAVGSQCAKAYLGLCGE